MQDVPKEEDMSHSHMKQRPVLRHPVDGCTRCLGTQGGTPGDEMLFSGRLVCDDCANCLNRSQGELSCIVCFRDLCKHKWLPFEVMKEEMKIGNIRTACMDYSGQNMVLCIHGADEDPCDEEFMKDISS